MTKSNRRGPGGLIPSAVEHSHPALREALRTLPRWCPTARTYLWASAHRHRRVDRPRRSAAPPRPAHRPAADGGLTAPPARPGSPRTCEAP